MEKYKSKKCPYCGSWPKEVVAGVECSSDLCPAKPRTKTMQDWNKREDAAEMLKLTKVLEDIKFICGMNASNHSMGIPQIKRTIAITQAELKAMREN